MRHPGEPDAVTVMVNGVPSSHLDLVDPTWLEFEYMQHMAAVIDLLPAGPLDAVHLGAAACALPRRVEAVRPGCRQLAVDVDAELLRLAREWFGLPRAPRLRLRTGDGRAVLAGLPDASADVVVRDAFAGDRVPDHLTTVEFVAEVHRVLRPAGVYLANCADRPPLARARAEVATAGTAFRTALVAEPGQLKGRRYGNLVVVGTREDGPALDEPALARALRALPVPATLLSGGALRSFVAGAAPLRDEATWTPPTAR
ncbi:spermidine synthase [Actinotalea sp. Marseille-Q4924]|uniref:spermidine synthase n=1 Tax=Actinotalea sp. Marseille-Q4924 TaxID=2866571 RepID=UPI001CE4A0BB|nr:fused MFS/spermidine synthase [Actinotalea sp. Marseille-Q4924]